MIFKKIIWWVVIGFILLVLGGLSYYFIVEKKERDIPKEIVYQLERELGGSVALYQKVLISRNFFRGKIQTADGLWHNIFAVKVAENWKLVSVTDGPPKCERMQRLGFPPQYFEDCDLEFPQAQTVKQFVEKKKISAPMQVIGKIDFPKEPGCDCFEFSSGGETVEISSDVFFGEDNIEVGDEVVLEVSPKDPDGNGGQTNVGLITDFVINVIDEVAGEESEKIKEESSSPDSSQKPDIPEEFDDDDSEEKDEDDSKNIKEPETKTNPPNYKYSIFDIDNSGKAIQIIGN